VQYLFAAKVSGEKDSTADARDADSKDDNSDAEASRSDSESDDSAPLRPKQVVFGRGIKKRSAAPKTVVELQLADFNDNTSPKEGDFWLIKPAQGRDAADKDAPFYIAQVRRNLPAEKSSHVSWYAPRDGWQGESPYTGKYVPEQRPCKIDKLDKLAWDSGWQWPIIFKHDMRPKAIVVEAMRKWAKVFADEDAGAAVQD
jgi:hypothetical protein